jgi:hypothetical protein
MSTSPVDPEDLGINPMPAQAERAVIMAEIATCRALIGHLDVKGLELVRRRMKSTDVVRISNLGNLAELRADCLDAACRRLVDLGRAPAAYYEPDMLPSVPDAYPNGDGV